ncbi:MAG: trxC [Devosia sp.]|uniref:thioredoxin TrxC n=1 Tax=Devosia sp. TaxID=1871048 RepID=UPI00261B2728|nr:thioredoxin TrxC [Devosia sp.]MDB5538413.1 trxC [Devosia sp.]
MGWPKTDTPMQVVCPNCAATNRIHPGQDPKGAKCGACHTKLFSGKVWPATQKTFDKQITRDDIPVVVDFWADWCAPCKAMAPIYEKAAEDLEPDFRFLKLDTEAEPEIAARYNIRAIPTMMVFRKGQIIGQRAGAIDRRTLEGWLRSPAPTTQ